MKPIESEMAVRQMDCFDITAFGCCYNYHDCCIGYFGFDPICFYFGCYLYYLRNFVFGLSCSLDCLYCYCSCFQEVDFGIDWEVLTTVAVVVAIIHSYHQHPQDYYTAHMSCYCYCCYCYCSYFEGSYCWTFGCYSFDDYRYYYYCSSGFADHYTIADCLHNCRYSYCFDCNSDYCWGNCDCFGCSDNLVEDWGMNYVVDYCNSDVDGVSDMDLMKDFYCTDSAGCSCWSFDLRSCCCRVALHDCHCHNLGQSYSDCCFDCCFEEGSGFGLIPRAVLPLPDSAGSTSPGFGGTQLVSNYN